MYLVKENKRKIIMWKILRLRFDNKFLKIYRATFEILCISRYTWNDIRSHEKSKLGDVYALPGLMRVVRFRHAAGNVNSRRRTCRRDAAAVSAEHRKEEWNTLYERNYGRRLERTTNIVAEKACRHKHAYTPLSSSYIDTYNILHFIMNSFLMYYIKTLLWTD